MYVYKAERPFQCELYGKRFKQKHHLKIHHVHIKDLMNVHEREKPYECDLFYKRFIRKSSEISPSYTYKGRAVAQW